LIGANLATNLPIIPNAPFIVYPEEWQGWFDFLGAGRKVGNWRHVGFELRNPGPSHVFEISR
jgi:hypothetical protein